MYVVPNQINFRNYACGSAVDMMVCVFRSLQHPISHFALVLGRTDLKYLQQFSEWFHRTFSVVEKTISPHALLEPILRVQMSKKQAASNRMLVYIFVSILRAMGIHCRLVLSFQVLPLRPPSDELCSLSTKADEKPNSGIEKGTTSKARSVEMLKAGKVESGVGTSAQSDELKIEKVSNSNKSRSRGVNLGTLKTNSEETKSKAKRESNAKPKSSESEEKGQAIRSPKKRELRSKQCDKEERPKLKTGDSKLKKDESKTSTQSKKASNKSAADGKINLEKLKSVRSKSTEPPEEGNLLRPAEKGVTRSRSAENKSGKEKVGTSRTGVRAKKEVLKIKMPKIELKQLDGKCIIHSTLLYSLY